MRELTLSSNTIVRLDARAILDILIVAVLAYYLLQWIRGTRALQILAVIAVLLAIYKAARWAHLEMVEWLLNALLPYFPIALIVLFQAEIRRGLARLGRNPFWLLASKNPTQGHDDLVLAVSYFSQNRIGALIAIERDVSLRTYVESGIHLDAVLSHDLLVAIFRPGSPLHDGAAIIQGERVAAAACFLPLSLNPTISNQLGTRHRAAIGVTEESDAVVVVVSEQTGAIGLATSGTIELSLPPEQLAARLATLFAGFRPRVALPEPPGGRWPHEVKDKT